MPASNTNTNILILGKSGVGKSSLLNYLLDEVVAEIGHGKPTTGEGIHKCRPFQYKGVNFTVYDSWGLEADKENKWKEIIENEIYKNNEKEMKDWFHSVVYCVDAERARVEDFEIRQILRPLVDDGNRILFVLTKSALNPANTKATEAMLRKEFPDSACVAVESVAAKLYGRTTEQQGREALLTHFFSNLWNNLIHKIIYNYEKDAISNLRTQFTSSVLHYFDKKAGSLGIFTHYGEEFRDDIVAFAKEELKTILGEDSQKLRKNISEAQNLVAEVVHVFGTKINVSVPDALNIDKHFSANWDNSFAEYLGTIIVALLLLRVFFRKGLYEIEVRKACVKIDDQAEAEIKCQCRNLREQYGVKDEKESSFGNIARSGTLYDFLEKVGNENKGGAGKKNDMMESHADIFRKVADEMRTSSEFIPHTRSANERLKIMLEKISKEDPSNALLKDLFERHDAESVKDLVEELCKDASNTFGWIFTGPVDYAGCVRRVAQKIGVPEADLTNNECKNEMFILQKVSQKYFDSRDPAEREKKVKEIIAKVGEGNEAFLGAAGPAYRKIVPSVLSIAVLRMQVNA